MGTGFNPVPDKKGSSSVKKVCFPKGRLEMESCKPFELDQKVNFLVNPDNRKLRIPIPIGNLFPRTGRTPPGFGEKVA